jgi:hypothetical protein
MLMSLNVVGSARSKTRTSLFAPQSSDGAEALLAGRFPEHHRNLRVIDHNRVPEEADADGRASVFVERVGAVPVDERGSPDKRRTEDDKFDVLAGRAIKPFVCGRRLPHNQRKPPGQKTRRLTKSFESSSSGKLFDPNKIRAFLSIENNRTLIRPVVRTSKHCFTPVCNSSSETEKRWTRPCRNFENRGNTGILMGSFLIQSRDGRSGKAAVSARPALPGFMTHEYPTMFLRGNNISSGISQDTPPDRLAHCKRLERFPPLNTESCFVKYWSVFRSKNSDDS